MQISLHLGLTAREQHCNLAPSSALGFDIPISAELLPRWRTEEKGFIKTIYFLHMKKMKNVHWTTWETEIGICYGLYDPDNLNFEYLQQFPKHPVKAYLLQFLNVDMPILTCICFTFNWLTLTSEMHFVKLLVYSPEAKESMHPWG